VTSRARSTVLLVLVGAVADLAEAMDENSPREAVAARTHAIHRAVQQHLDVFAACLDRARLGAPGREAAIANGMSK
jgi:hypothetical protein